MKLHHPLWFLAWSGACVIGLGLFGYSLTQQTEIQLQMGHTMGAVNQSVVQTSGIVASTSEALSPLLATTKALAGIETQEQQTVTDLQGMNDKLQKTAVTEQSIILHLNQLNGTTNAISGDLSGLSSVNGRILGVSQQSSSQGSIEAGRVGDLNGMTDVSISQLNQINHRLEALKLLP
jgi:hypothetical protein